MPVKKRVTRMKRKINYRTVTITDIMVREEIKNGNIKYLDFPKRFRHKKTEARHYFYESFALSVIVIKRELRKKEKDKKIQNMEKKQSIMFSIEIIGKDSCILKIHNDAIAKKLNMPKFNGFTTNSPYSVYLDILKRIKGEIE